MAKNSNVNSTRYYSEMQENEVAEVLCGTRTINSGASLFSKGDVVVKDTSMLVECKTCMSEKESFSVKKDWLVKNKAEMRSQRFDNSVVAFNFGPGQDSYYIIDKKLMRMLMEKLREFYS